MDVIFAGLTLLAGTSRDVLPIVLFIFGFQAFVIRQPIPNLKLLLSGLVLVIVGLTLFLLGLEQALFPVGRLMAEQLTATGAGSNGYLWVYLFAVAIGFSTAIAEPALLAVAINIGVAIGVGLGAYRIISGTPLHYFMIAGYIIVVIQTVWAPKLIIPLAYDSGGVTTSTVTVPLVAALGLGLAEAVPGRSQLLDGFGLVASACLFPIIAVLAYAQISLLWSYLRNRRAGHTKNISVEEK
jgi:hypothetical protein